MRQTLNRLLLVPLLLVAACTSADSSISEVGVGRSALAKCQASVAWAPLSLELSLQPGSTQQTQVTLSIAQSRPASRITVSAPLAPFLSVSPTKLPAQNEQAQIAVSLVFSVPSGTPTQTVVGAQDYAEQRTRLDAHMAQREKLVLIAHSQGNLFMNAAYDYGVGVVGSGAIKAVHVAPASPTLRGAYTLADLDLVINALRLVGTVPANNVSIPAIPPLGDRPAPYDASGHELVATYLDQRLDTNASVVSNLAGGS